MLDNFTLKDPFETLVLLDQEVKHEARGGLVRKDDSKNGERNFLIFFSRRPKISGSEKETEGVEKPSRQRR